MVVVPTVASASPCIKVPALHLKGLQCAWTARVRDYKTRCNMISLFVNCEIL